MQRSRYKERVEACVSWICALEALRERQESLVRGALRGDAANGDAHRGHKQQDHSLKRQLNRLQDAPCVLMLVLQQQLSDLRLDTCDQSNEDDLDSPSSSGFYEQSETLSPPRRSNSSPSLSYPSHRSRSVDSYTLDWESQRDPAPRALLPRSFSAPYPPLEGIAEGTEEEEEDEDDEDGALWSEGQVEDGEIVNSPEMGPTMDLDEEILTEDDDEAEEEDQKVEMDEYQMVEVGEDFMIEVVNDHTKELDESLLAEEEDEGPLEQEEEEEELDEDEGPTAEDYEQAMRVEAYILGLIHRCSLTAPGDSTAGLGSISNHWQDLHIYQPNPNFCDPQPDHQEWQNWVTLDEEEEQGEVAQEIYYNLDSQSRPRSLVCEDQEPCLEMDQYGAMDPTITSSDPNSFHYPLSYLEHQHPSLDSQTSHYIHSHNSLPLDHESAKEDWMPHSLEASLPQPLPRRQQEEVWAPIGQRQVRTTSRSHSESSFLPGGWGNHPNQRCHTVGRDGSGHRSDFDYLSNQRLWSSFADLSQEEDDRHFRREELDVRSRHPPFHTLPQGQYPQGQPQRPRNRTNGRASRADGSDSSLSETCSPASSSLSSDSDDSGGLVWPLQLPPRLPSSSSSPSGAVVKIKASHALKRKIMRFRSGSLKVMTTV